MHRKFSVSVVCKISAHSEHFLQKLGRHGSDSVTRERDLFRSAIFAQFCHLKLDHRSLSHIIIWRF